MFGEGSRIFVYPRALHFTAGGSGFQSSHAESIRTGRSPVSLTFASAPTSRCPSHILMRAAGDTSKTRFGPSCVLFYYIRKWGPDVQSPSS